MRTVLVLTTCFGLLLVSSDRAPVSSLVLVFYTAFFTFVYLVQMVFRDVPRAASIFAGALFMPLTVYGSIALPVGPDGLVEQVLPRLNASHRLPWLIGIGGFLGYLSGTVLASVFMVADQLGRLLAGCREFLGLGEAHDHLSGLDSRTQPHRNDRRTRPERQAGGTRAVHQRDARADRE